MKEWTKEREEKRKKNGNNGKNMTKMKRKYGRRVERWNLMESLLHLVYEEEQLTVAGHGK